MTEEDKIKQGFEIPSRMTFKATKTFNLKTLHPFWLMMLLEPEIDEQGNIISLRVMKAFKRESAEDKQKHQKQEQPKETLDSFVDEDEQI